ncbi:MAG TPA: response regulator, partial [Candidatus Aminicenantes bacterium]|nr:response regulator [Candidatus Aminicenantes bacterium]
PGRILLMDDEEMVREVFRDMIADTPIRLDTACDSRETLAAFQQARQDGDPYELIFLDLTVPGDIGGIKTLQRLWAIDPAVKAIATSGYSDSEVFSDPGKYHFQGIMAKPFRLEDLHATLERFL